jgi:uronate dehydrogenase
MMSMKPVWAITGAAGRIGTVLRAGLSDDVETMHCLDLRPMPSLAGHEVGYELDLADLEGTVAALRGCNGVIHLGGYPTEADFHDLAQVNIVGTYHVLEAARRAGVKRVAYASSNRITGFYPVGTKVSTSMPVRPDSLYGVSKAAGEALCRLYVDKFGLSAVCVRIGTFINEPGNTRHLSTWASQTDTVRAFRAAMTAPGVTYATIYAASNNEGLMWDMSPGEALGFHPVDRAEIFADRFEGQARPAPTDFQSGADMTSEAHTLSMQRAHEVQPH